MHTVATIMKSTLKPISSKGSLVIQQLYWWVSVYIFHTLPVSLCTLVYSGVKQSRMHINLYNVYSDHAVKMVNHVKCCPLCYHCMIKALSEKWQPSLVSAPAQPGRSSVELWLNVLSDSLGRMPWYHCIACYSTFLWCFWVTDLVLFSVITDSSALCLWLTLCN